MVRAGGDARALVAAGMPVVQRVEAELPALGFVPVQQTSVPAREHVTVVPVRSGDQRVLGDVQPAARADRDVGARRERRQVRRQVGELGSPRLVAVQ